VVQQNVKCLNNMCGTADS